MWTATLTKNQEDFAALVQPVHRFLQETPDRVPMTDWYETESGKRVGFTARPVVGGVFMRMLYDDGLWQKWARRDQTKAGDYAPMPRIPKMSNVVPTADSAVAQWRFTIDEPSGEWTAVDYDDSQWKLGRSGFGTHGTPAARVGTDWHTSEIWLRRTFDVTAPVDQRLRLRVHHDEDVEIYINGVLARRIHEYTLDYEHFPIRAEALGTIKPRGNVFAVHCQQSSGGQYIDVGLATLETATR